MAKQSRKDSKGRVLHTGEYEEQKRNRDGRAVSYYVYKYQDVTGKRSRISATTLPELREKEAKLQKDLMDGLRTGHEREKTVDEMTTLYLETKINLRSTTASNYEYMAAHFITGSRVGNMKVTAVTKTDIQKFYGDLLKQGLSSNTVENIHTILHPVFKRAIDDGYIRINPTDGVMADIKKSELWKKSRRPALTLEQQTAFVEYVAASPVYSHWMPLFAFLLGTGCRIGETIGLCWEDVDLEAGVVTIRHNLVYRRDYSRDVEAEGGMVWNMHGPKTEDGAREIPLLQDVRRALLRVKAERLKGRNVAPLRIDGEDYNIVFRNRYGTQLVPMSVNRAIKRIVRDYNAEETARAAKEHREPAPLPNFSVHQLRHTFCTRLCENSSNVKAIQAIMGHSDIETTMNIYAEATRAARRNTLDELEGKVKIIG